jgi:Protein of unknown function (DUF3347)
MNFQSHNQHPNSVKMKFAVIVLFGFFFFSVNSSSGKISKSAFLSYDSTIRYPLSSLLPMYYSLKNALVNSDASSASLKAGALMNAFNNVDMKLLSPAESKVFMSLQSKLIYESRRIAEVQKIEHQREHFASLSNNMYSLAKSIRLSNQPVYRDYCPMKKAYWLSADKEIKNPYYGSEMPDCGNVTNVF